MSIASHKFDRMTPEEFLAWQLRQDRLYEFVDGLPLLPLKMMAGATQRHDRVVINAILSLGKQLRGKPCRPMTSYVAVSIPKGNFRRPDVTVECGQPASDLAMTAAEPRLAIEVLSPSTLSFDRFRKLEEYKTVPGLGVILLVDTELPQVTVHRRRGAAWEVETTVGLESTLDLPEIGARLSFADLYEGVAFEASKSA